MELYGSSKSRIAHGGMVAVLCAHRAVPDSPTEVAA